MKKMLLILPLFFTASLAFAAGGPIPGVNVSLEQIPGGVYHTQGDCLKQGGQIMHKRGKTYCVMKRLSGPGSPNPEGDFTLKNGGILNNTGTIRK